MAIRLNPKAKVPLYLVLALYVVFVVTLLVTAFSQPRLEDKWMEKAKASHPEMSANEAAEAFAQQRIAQIVEVFKADGAEVDHDLAERIYRETFFKKGELIPSSPQKLMKNITGWIQILNFGVLVLLLYGFLWEPLVKMLDERREQIKHDLDSARAGHEKAEKVLAQHQEKLAGVEAEIDQLRNEGRREGREERQKIIVEAKLEAKSVIEKGQEELNNEIKQANKELQREIGNLSAQLAGKMLEREMNEKDHEALISDFLGELERK